MAAKSFCTSTSSSDGLARALRETRSSVASASGGLVFVTGSSLRLRAVAEQIRTAWRGVPTIVTTGSGVLHERGEMEGTSAASGILWSNGKVMPFALDEPSDDPHAFGAQIGRSFGSKAAAAVVFHQIDSFDPLMLEGIASTSPTSHVFGAGTVGHGLLVTSDGDMIEAAAVGLGWSGVARPIVAASTACRLLTDFEPIEEVADGLVLRVGSNAALDALSRCSANKPKQQPPPVVLAALSDPADASDNGRDRFFIRPIRGIDTTRRGLMIGDDARPGMRFAFAVRDASAARADLDTTTRFVAQNMLGSAPQFGIYLTCTGRGQEFYGAPDVESRALRQRFGDLPIAGMQSAFEITPRDKGAPRLELYSSVLAVFRSLS